MKRLLFLILCFALMSFSSLAEAPSDDGTLMPELGGPVTGNFDTPALSEPESRYDFYMEQTDGSEQGIFALLDGMNDEATDIETHGALYVTENMLMGDDLQNALQMHISIQKCPYGNVMIASYNLLGSESTSYWCGNVMCIQQNGEYEISEDQDVQAIRFYSESYHFPYGRLETLNGVRQDENGYTYLLVKSDDDISFEFVMGEGMRILQLRMYAHNESGTLQLASYADYDVGPALEIPPEVLEAFSKALPLEDDSTE